MWAIPVTDLPDGLVADSVSSLGAALGADATQQSTQKGGDKAAVHSPLSIEYNRGRRGEEEVAALDELPANYGHAMALHLVGSDIVHLDTGTFMWVQLTHFSIDGTLEDRAVLGELIASPGYVHDYATPFQSEAALVEPQIHGRWRLSEIHVEQFEPWSATAAKHVIHDWANNHDWTDPNYRPPPEIHSRLQAVDAVFERGQLYKLRNPGPEAEHEHGFVTGAMGFHEFVVIDRDQATLHVVVASDD